MFNTIEFSLNTPLNIAFLSAFSFPFLLILMSRFGKLRYKNAQQFFWCSIVTSLIYLAALLSWMVRTQFTLDYSALVVSVFTYLCALIVYLESWALISRGYTLGLLLTLNNATTPLTVENLSQQYRGGDGLEWIVRHRISGLIGAKIVREHDNSISLTFIGVFIAKCYQLIVKVLGLRYTG